MHEMKNTRAIEILEKRILIRAVTFFLIQLRHLRKNELEKSLR